MIGNGAESSQQAPVDDQDSQPASQPAVASESADGISPAALLVRLRLMWRNGPGLPVRSDMPRAAAASSWQLCVNARQAREDFLLEANVLVEGVLAREEMTGYIIGDAVDLPVMPAKKAMDVGEKAYKQVGPKDCKMKKTKKQVKKDERARHSPATDEERAAVEAKVERGGGSGGGDARTHRSRAAVGGQLCGVGVSGTSGAATAGL